MTSKLPFKSWSCGSLIAGAAAVADQMPQDASNNVACVRKQINFDGADLSTEELEKILKDTNTKCWRCWSATPTEKTACQTGGS